MNDVLRSLLGGGPAPKKTASRKAVDEALDSVHKMAHLIAAAEVAPEVAGTLMLQCEAAMLAAGQKFRDAAALIEKGVPLVEAKPAEVAPVVHQKGGES